MWAAHERPLQSTARLILRDAGEHDRGAIGKFGDQRGLVGGRNLVQSLIFRLPD